jgi:hypothetical protein
MRFLSLYHLPISFTFGVFNNKFDQDEDEGKEAQKDSSSSDDYVLLDPNVCLYTFNTLCIFN